MDKIYEPQKTEQRIYRLWKKSGYFNPDKLPNKKGKPFCIIMPPPNANAPLHIGHGVFVTLQDIIIRYQRMKGRKTLWLPGTDHAGFETQVVFEKKLKKEGKSGFDMPRNEFYKAVLEYTQKNRKIVRKQLEQLGASCDWSREKFTLDKDIQKIVYKTLERLWKDELLYRGKRIVNYCPKHKTAFSDLEVKHKEEKGKLYFVKYRCKDKKSRKKSITIATTRPETIPGDVAIAVNPNDIRYKELVGEMVIEPITRSEIPIISDKTVDIDFGTGALKITPAHDSLDFEIGQRHSLETKETLDFDGFFNKLAGPLLGLNIAQAREKSVDILRKNGALIKEEDYTHEVGHCYKCETVIEPMLMDQWFMAVTKLLPDTKKSLRDLAVDAVKNKKIKIIPKYFEKVFFHWMKNIKDWNISRQIYWGIPIPAYHCDDCGKSFIKTKGKILNCIYCQSKNIKEDSDVLDAWFSSGQWPFATLLTSKNKKDFKTFYPTDVMETGWDILFFWVARMIMFGIYCAGEIPFKTVYLHGLVRDKDRQKMSKSKGNVINPLAIAEIYGTDAIRMALIIGNTAGSDIIISEEKIRGYRNFANKIWNASRFVLINLKDFNGKKPVLTAQDKKLLKNLEIIKKKMTNHLDNFHFSLAGELIYHYFWHTFADKIIEEMKNRIRDNKNKKQAQYVLYKVLVDCLKMLHPFMPFVTEEIWQKIPQYENKMADLLIIEKWL